MPSRERGPGHGRSRHGSAGSGRHRLVRFVFGPSSVVALSRAHALSAAGDGFVAVSLAGSLFFNVSSDASRSQVLLYLLLTMVPFAVLAPLVAPLIDRLWRAQRFVAAGSYAIRALLCLALAEALFHLAFYVLVVGLLVASKASGVVKQALMPNLVADPDQLLPSNARLSRLAAVSGGAGGGVATGILEIAGAPWVLRCAAVLFAAAAIAALFLRPRLHTDARPAELEFAERHSPRIVVASIGFMAIRAAVGFFVLMLAFTLRRESEAAWVYAAAVVMYGAGAFAGNLIALPLRRRFHDDQLIALALVAPATLTLVGTLGVTRPLLLAAAVLVGLSTTLGRQGFDSLLQRTAPDVFRGRAFARYETRFQLAWVVGGVVATAIAYPVEVSMALLTAMYVPAIALFVRAARAAERFEDDTTDDVLGLALARLAIAERAYQRSSFRVAIVEASAAADLGRIARRGAYAPAGHDLDELRRAASDPAAVVTADDAARALVAARAFVRADVPPATS